MPAFPISQPGASARLPTPPTSVSASASAGTVNGTAGAVSVSFTASTNPGKPSGNYVATSNPGSVTASAASSPIAFSAGTLTAGTAYTFSIVKQSGSGITSAAATTGSVTPFTVPAAPTSVSASANATSGEVVVSWTAPSGAANTGGSAITNYYIDYSTVLNFSSGVTTINTGSTSTSRTVSGLTNGTTYYFRVRAQNAAGQSLNSLSANDAPYAPPSFGTETKSSTATTPGTSTTSVSGVSTTTATLGYSLGSGAAFAGYERISGTAVTPSGSSLSGLAAKTAHSWRVLVTNTGASNSITTKVTPNGSTATVSVGWDTGSGLYNNSATSGGNLSVNIGASNSEQSTTWSLALGIVTTVYYRITVSYRGGATVTKTGTLSPTISVFNGTAVDFNTYGTYTYNSTNNNISSMHVTKPSYGVDITSISVDLAGGGGGGTSNSGYGAGGGGGGRYVTSSGITSNNNIAATRGGPGGVNGYGGTTSFTYSAGTVSAEGGTPAAGAQGGASPRGGGNYYYGYVGNLSYGGGGGGAGGAATDINGGSSYFGVGPGGPGYFNLAPYGGAGYGSWGAGGSSTSVGAGGQGGFDNNNASGGNAGLFVITYTGPHRDGGSLADP